RAGGARHCSDRRRGRQHPRYQTGGIAMNRKRLPKAIRPAIDESDETPTEPRAGSPQHESKPAPPDPGLASSDLDAAPAPAPQADPPPVARALAPATPSGSSDLDAERRRLLAYAVVERHAAYSAVGGIVPLPIVNVASITAIIVRMVKEL